MLEHALALAAAGHPVLWVHAPLPEGRCTCGRVGCTSQGKHPVARAWQRVATTDEHSLRESYAALKFPSPNIGIRFGAREDGSYLVVVDVDSGERVLQLGAEHGDLPHTLTWHSARGAKSVYRLPEGIDLKRVRNVTGLGGQPGVDVKAEGGMAVAPPSRHRDGSDYAWFGDGLATPIAELPIAWALLLLRPLAPPPAPRGRYTPGALPVDDARARKRAASYYEANVRSAAELLSRTGEGGRNSALNHSLYSLLSLAAGGCSSVPGAVGYAIRTLSEAAQHAGLDAVEVSATVRSVERAVAADRPTREIPDRERPSAIALAPAPPPAPEPPEPPGIELIEHKGEPQKIAENVARVLCALRPVRRDRFSGAAVWLEDGATHTDSRTYEIQGWLTSQRLHSCGVEAVEAGIARAADMRPFDSLVDHVEALPAWDGTPRVDTWLTRYAGAVDSPVNRLFGRRWLISTIARALVPGCPADLVLVLEGAQGIGKNRLINTLFGDAPFVQSIGGYRIGHDVEVDRIAASAWVVHDDEFTGKKSDLDAMKAWVSATTKTVRLPYARNMSTLTRRAVLVASTNESLYLTDTSNRRYLPVKCGKIDLSIPREQVLAEALALYRSGEAWLLSTEEVQGAGVREAQDSRRARDPLEDEVRHFVERLEPAARREFAPRALFGALGVESKQRDHLLERRAGVALKALGYERVRVRAPTVGSPLAREYRYRRVGGRATSVIDSPNETWSETPPD